MENLEKFVSNDLASNNGPGTEIYSKTGTTRKSSSDEPAASNGENPTPFPKLPAHLFCQICSVKSLSVANHKLHLQGKRHLKSLKVTFKGTVRETSKDSFDRFGLALKIVFIRFFLTEIINY